MAGRGRRKRGNMAERGSRTKWSKATIMNNFFVEAGIPSSFPSPPELNMIGKPKTRSRAGEPESFKPSSSSRSGARKVNQQKNFGYVYPDFDSQGTGICATSHENQNVIFDYSFGSSFILDGSSHKGLGFCDDSDVNNGGTSEKQDQEGSSTFITADNENSQPDSTQVEQSESPKDHPRKNSAFISIGGVKLFTEDISDEETGSANEVDASNSDDSASNDNQFSESSLSESGSDIDDDVFDDYLEGIGGRENLFESKWLLQNELNDSEDGTSSSSSFDETVQRLGGIALQEASREYGMKTPKSRVMNSSSISSFHGSTSSTKKHRSHRNSRRFLDTKKKYRKEMMNSKRRERMLNRGVDLKKMNAKMEQIVMNKVDIFSFESMHSKDCSQLRRLAAIYRLQSGCQGSGNKRFVTVTRTQYTSMPSSSDKIRLIQLIGSDDDGKRRVVSESQFQRKASRQRVSSSRKRGGNEGSTAKQAVVFVASGTMESESAEVAKSEGLESRKKGAVSGGEVGAFELHTRGFGSKMMSKMGYVEGEGLGKSGQGMAEPIGVVQRPKSLGLGFDLPSCSDAGKDGEVREVGGFEKHTRGFGSKVMAKMGFVQGIGLGRNSQGITTPLSAVRRPKARGLGA